MNWKKSWLTMLFVTMLVVGQVSAHERAVARGRYFETHKYAPLSVFGDQPSYKSPSDLEGLGHKKVHELGWHGRKVYNELLHKAEIVELDDDADVYYDTATMEIRYFGGCKRGGKIFFNRAKFVAEEHHEVRRAEVVPPPPPPPKIVLPPPVRVVVQAPPPPPRPVNHWICREFKTPIMRCNVRIGWHHESFWVLVDSYNRPIRGAQRLPYRPGFNPNHREYAERAEQRQFQEERNDAPNPTSYAQRDDRRFQERRQPQRDQVFDDIQRELGN